MGQTDPGGRNYTGEYKNIFIFLIRPKTRPALLSEEERDEKGYHFTEKSLKVIEKARKGTLPTHDAVVRHSTRHIIDRSTGKTLQRRDVN